jgi:hypothetical protein
MTKKRTMTLENVIRPGSVRNVDATMYEAARTAFLKVLPKRPPGLTADEIRGRMLDHLPED